jgi:peptidoglycan/xylan/chitin deacetylase (PgdA/CDA1 family)
MFITLMYHIIDRTIDAKTAISEEAFEAQLDYLNRHNCTVLSLAQAINAIDGKRALPERSVLLTFDDGYINNVNAALPRLRARNMTAVLFTLSKYIGQTNRWDLKACYNVDHLTWSELMEWLDSDCEIGGHSHTHICLTRLGVDEMKSEILLNKRVLEDGLGIQLRAFSYPYGEFNAQVQSIVANYYEVAFATDAGGWPSERNRYMIKRLDVSPEWSIIEFGTRLETLFRELGRTHG